MDTLRETILVIRARSENDDVLMDSIDDLVKKEGATVAQAVFNIFADLSLSPEVATEYWNDLRHHRSQMKSSLERDVCIMSAMCDFLSDKVDLALDLQLVVKANYDNMLKRTSRDDLTQLYNRQYLNNALNQQLALATRNHSELSLLFLDVDDFKDINDSYGHKTGDEVLQVIASVIHSAVRQSDIAARYGGEEFVVLMPLTMSIEALILANRIREGVEQIQFSTGDNERVPITVSGGIASYPSNANSAEELTNLADRALYIAKGTGKNHISLFRKDSRRFLRIDLKEKVQVKELGFSNPRSFLGTSKDICVGGILFENSSPLDIGSKIQVSVPIGEKEPVLLIGTVVRVEAIAEDRFDVGVVLAFKEMDKLAKNEISRFLVDQSR